MRNLLACILLSVTAAALTGCEATPAASSVEPAPVAADRYASVYGAAVDVLRDTGFRVDRQDYRFGRITTQAQQSPSIFEPWYRDNSNLQQTLASTADQLQRRVNVMLDPVEPMSDVPAGSDENTSDIPHPTSDMAYTLTVEVILERRAYPLRRLNGTAERRQLVSLDAVPEEWKDRGITETYAEPIGRDAEMERRLVSEIMARAEAK